MPFSITCAAGAMTKATKTKENRKPEMAKKPTTPQLPRCCPAASKSPPGPGKDIRMGVEDHEGQDEPEQVEGVVAGPEVTGSE